MIFPASHKRLRLRFFYFDTETKTALPRIELEKRQTQRLRTLKRVHAAFNGDFCAVDCVLKNISDTGALISFEDGILIPKNFLLVNRMDGYRVKCEIVRRIGNTAGVRFIGEFEGIEVTRKQVVQAPNFKEELSDLGLGIEADLSETKEMPTRSFTKKHRPAFGKRGTLKSM